MRKNVKLEGCWYNKERDLQHIKNIRKKATMMKRPAKCAPPNMESNIKSLADWLQTRDYPSRSGKTKKERKFAEFVSVQKQAYVGNHKPYLTMDAIRKLEELPGWISPLPSFGEMLEKLDVPSPARPAPSHDRAYLPPLQNPNVTCMSTSSSSPEAGLPSEPVDIGSKL